MEKNALKHIERTPLRDRVYTLLQRAIISGELKPGQRLRDQDLAIQMGVSRTPVREALQRLEDEGLVETKARALTRVVSLDTRAALDTFPVVAALQALAARLAGTVTEQHVAAMREANRALAAALEAQDVIKAIEADDAFHRVIVQAASKRELEQTLGRLRPKIRHMEYAQFGSLAGRRSVQQHEGIIAACEAGDQPRVARLVEHNWLSLGQLIIASFYPRDEEDPEEEEN